MPLGESGSNPRTTTVPWIIPLAGYEDPDALRSTIRAILRRFDLIFSSLRSRGSAALVVVKPNWVQQSHEYAEDVWVPVITHPNLVLAVLNEVAGQMEGRGTICLCDAPHSYASFDAILARGGLESRAKEFRRRWPGLRLEIIDLRREVWVRQDEVVVARLKNAEDPRGYTALDLGKDSLLYRFRGEGRYYGADYDSEVVNAHHHGDVHEYLLAGTAIACDLFINLPKMKTHKKTGITCSIKNLVGINGDKNWLPHHTEGSPRRGGDEFSTESVVDVFEGVTKKVGRRLALKLPGAGTWAYRKARRMGIRVLGDSQTVVRNGNWIGNDTCWRMACDLNRCLLYGEPDGTWRGVGQTKPYLSIVDGIIGGEGNGPLCPDPVGSGVLVAGTDPAAVDAVVAKLMGFDPTALPVVMGAFESHRWPIAQAPFHTVRAHDDRLGREVGLDEVVPVQPGGFRPHFGWVSLRRAV